METEPSPPAGGNDRSDEAVRERATAVATSETFDRLWRGETMGADSQSKADMPPCALLAF